MSSKKLPLPFVEEVCSCFPALTWDNVRIIGIQNLLPTTFRMFLSLFNRGLKPANVTLIGKCYSTSPEVVADFKRLGCDIAPLSTFFEPEKPYDIALQGYLDDYFQQKICAEDFSPFSKVIVMDDGGEFLEKMQMHRLGSNLIGIEQTSTGYHKLKDKPLLFPIVNVGRSEIKLKYEAPLIAWTAVDKLKERFARLPNLPHSVAVIGSGPIGNAIHSFLKKKHQFSLTHIKNSQEIKEYQGKWKDFEMIIGCTGKTLFQTQDFAQLKPGVILVSASYSDGEFNAAAIRKKAPKISSCHQDITADGLHLLNCGFPVNFDDHYDTVDPEVFQLTRALLMTAIFQAMQSPANGHAFIDLDAHVQKRIENSVLNDPHLQEILSYALE